ncbi:MAG TPA: N-acetylneuraminate synthase family protein, partial [Thermoanaerobaculia bacterium]|nr:N-acetylneuraminate synthase family protein [Thermoanaerobaculia bacterium]
VDVAVDAGADAVKFQKRDLGSLYPPSLLQNPNGAEWAFRYVLPNLQASELADDDFRRLRDHCDERGILFLCTPWDAESLGLLEELGVPAYKISSPDLVNLPLLDAAAATGKPHVISTGISTPHENEVTVAHLRGLGAAFALLHCVSAYPAPFEALNLRYLEALKAHGVPVGYSSHERGISVPVVAFALGASIVEKHVTLDRTLPGPDHAASLEPHGFAKMVRDLRIAEQALGVPEKHLCQIEVINRQVLRKSLIAARDLPAGTVIEADMVRVSGPGKGLSPQRLPELLGVRLERDVREGEPYGEGDLDPAPPEVLDTSSLRRPWGLKARFHDLEEVLALSPELVELHFSESDVDHPFEPPAEPLAQRLAIHAPEFAESRLLDLAAERDEDRERSIALMQRTIDKAASLAPHFSGTPSVVIHVGGMSMDGAAGDAEAAWRRALDSFRRLEDRGVVLLPENLPPRPWYFGGQWFQTLFVRPEEMVEFCRELGVGMTLDLSHAALFCAVAGRDLGEYVELCLPHTMHLHVADASGIDGEGIQIGEGVIEWERILDLLRDRDFTWVPEIWDGHLHDAAGFRAAINRLIRLGGL